MSDFDDRFFEINYGITKWHKVALVSWLLGLGCLIKWVRGLWIQSLFDPKSSIQPLITSPIFFYMASMFCFALCLSITIECASIYESKSRELETLHKKVSSLSSEMV